MTILGHEIPDILTDIFELRVFYRVVLEQVQEFVDDLNVIEREIHTDTAQTYGIRKREQMMNLEPAVGESAENRQQRIRLFESEPLFYSVGGIAEWLHGFDKDIHTYYAWYDNLLIVETMKVELPLGSDFLTKAVQKKLEAICPIHMDVSVSGEYKPFSEYKTLKFSQLNELTFNELKTKS